MRLDAAERDRLRKERDRIVRERVGDPSYEHLRVFDFEEEVELAFAAYRQALPTSKTLVAV